MRSQYLAATAPCLTLLLEGGRDEVRLCDSACWRRLSKRIADVDHVGQARHLLSSYSGHGI
jgi:chorismate mutase